MKPPAPSGAPHTPPNVEGSRILAWLLAALAGCVDAVGLTHGVHTYLSFMSGNTTKLVAHLAGHRWHVAGIIASVIGTFVFGAFVGEWLDVRLPRFGRPLVLLLEAACLAAAGVTANVLPATFAMGVQTCVMHRTHGISIGLTYVTGTLVQIGRSLAIAELRTAGLFLALWCSLAAGAGAGMILAQRPVFIAMVVPAAAALLLSIATAVVSFASSRHRQ